MFDRAARYLSHQSVRAKLKGARSFLGRHILMEAMLVSVSGWSLMWADALSLVTFVPIWLSVMCFYSGLAMIPFCRSRPPL